ncbi:hypothetical protein CLOM_g3605 [Closterium sp. NIES-68]|nr:hypothetical protein CLOM_g3605 [Closterium sp. NIES-68]GJP63697.1 hypothetical protein CLOP_g20756 [Closterium sp. NIES-67]GJP73623.1 hypothetical protein CLOP_g4318 [Closterium sp. NIES-67]
MAPFWEFRVHSVPNPHPQLGQKPRPSALLIPEPVDPPPTPRPCATQPPRPSAHLPKILNQSLWPNQPPLFLSAHPAASIPEPSAPSLAPPPAPRTAQGRKPRQRPPRQPKLWDLLPELPPAPRPYAPSRPPAPPLPSKGEIESALVSRPSGQPSATPFWQPAPRNPNRQVSIGFPTAGSGGVIDLSTWGSATGGAVRGGDAGRGRINQREWQRDIPQIPSNSATNSRKSQERGQARGSDAASASNSQIQAPPVARPREGLAAPLIVARAPSSQPVICGAAAASSARVEDPTLSTAAPSSRDLSVTRQHRDSCTCSVDYSSLWGSLISAAADVASVVGEVASLIAPLSPTSSSLTSSARIPLSAAAKKPTGTSVAALATKGVGSSRAQSPSSVLQTHALSDISSEPSPDTST